MRIKRFVAPTLKEVLALTKKELGADAVILKSSTMKKGGLLDFNGKESVEVMAAIDQGYKPILPPQQGQVAPSVVQQITPSVQYQKPAANNQQMIILQTDVNELKSNIEQVSNFLKYQNVPALPKNLQFLMKQLLDNEVEEEIARTIVEDIHNEISGDQYDNMRLILSIALDKIGALLRVNGSGTTQNNGPRIIMLVGPTGVGRTTTIAKLATNQKLLNKKRVALISADTFRIGAIDQLKTFANIAEIPLSVVYTPDDMKSAIKNYNDMDVIYIDTTGRSQRDTTRIKDMEKFVASARPHENHLVLSVTTRLKDMIDAANRFSKLKFNRLIVTKTDETTSLGMILNVAAKVKTPVTYITTGQNVPEDIERATVQKLARMIVRRKGN